MKKPLSLLLVTLLLLTLLAPAALARGRFIGYLTVVNCNSWVTLRAKPSASAATVTRISLGETVEAYAYNGQFYECYYLGMHGYILSQYLGYGYTPTPSREYLGYQTVVNCNSWVTLRATPSTSASTVARVPLGAMVESWSCNYEFNECYYNGLHGYILRQYLY